MRMPYQLTPPHLLTPAERATLGLEDALLVGDIGMPPWLTQEQEEVARLLTESFAPSPRRPLWDWLLEGVAVCWMLVCLLLFPGWNEKAGEE